MPRLKKPHGLLGTCGAARFLRVHRATLDSWRRRGVLTPTAVEEGRYRYSVGALEAFRINIEYT